MKKIAVIVACSIYNRKGLFNAVHQRILHLKEIANYQIDAYIINSYIPDYISKIRHQPVKDRPKIFSLDGVNYNVLWYKNSIIDYILVHKFSCSGIFRKLAFKGFIHRFQSYDLLNVHSGCNDLGYYVKQLYKIPYIQTWHGTDIHTIPFESEETFRQTKAFVEAADYNFFVSQTLMDTSDKITSNGNKAVLYNGRNMHFYKYDAGERKRLRGEFGIVGKKIVGFVGNLIDVKNTKSFSPIFTNIYNKLGRKVEFWIIGDGANLNQLKLALHNLPVKFWGNQPPESMPDYMNCIDVLVLPSFNEGLPLTTIEALSCGSHVVGSRVGGIPESIGIENTINLNDSNFTCKFANRVIELINNPQTTQELSSHFDWKETAQKEDSIIREILTI